MIALAALALMGCGSVSAPSPSTPATETSAIASDIPAATPVVTEPMPSPRDVTPEARLELGDPTALEVTGLIVTDAGVWVGRDGIVSRIDPQTNEVVQAVEVGTEATPYAAFAIGFGSLWVSVYSEDLLRRFDIDTGELLAEVAVGPLPAGVATTADAVWVANHHGGSISRIDPATNKVTATVEVGPTGMSGPNEVVAEGDTVWAGVPNLPGVVAIDAASGTVAQSVTIQWPAWACGPPRVISADVWISSCVDQTIVAVADTESKAQRGLVDVGGYAGTPVPGAGLVWLPVSETEGSDAVLVGIDPVTLEIRDAIDVGAPAYQAAIGFGSIWLEAGGILTRLPVDALGGR